MLARGLQDLITFELVDYRDFAKQHPGEFDRIISCEMVRQDCTERPRFFVLFFGSVPSLDSLHLDLPYFFFFLPISFFSLRVGWPLFDGRCFKSMDVSLADTNWKLLRLTRMPITGEHHSSAAHSENMKLFQFLGVPPSRSNDCHVLLCESVFLRWPKTK